MSQKRTFVRLPPFLILTILPPAYILASCLSPACWTDRAGRLLAYAANKPRYLRYPTFLIASLRAINYGFRSELLKPVLGKEGNKDVSRSCGRLVWTSCTLNAGA